MIDIVRWGVLGASRFAMEKMAPALHIARWGRLDALATSNFEKGLPFQNFAPDIRVYDNYEDLLEDPKIDAIYIPLPNNLHIEWCRRAIQSGKHVLCEKPIAMKAAEIDELIELRDASGLLVAEAFMIVHHPQWSYARELYQSGAIGNVRLVDCLFTYFNDDMANIRNRPETGGGGVRDIGVYCFGATRFVTGEEPKRIIDATCHLKNGVDTFCQVIAEFPGFHFSSMTSTRLARRQEFTLHGEKGMIRLTCPFNSTVFGQAEVELSKNDMEVSVRRYPGDNHYVLQIENFNQSVLNRQPFPCPLEFSKGSQLMIDQVLGAAS